MRYDVILFTLAVLLIAGLFLLPVIGAVAIGLNQIPQCQEDVVLIGQGNFEDGRWDYYVCGPAVDDYIQ